MRRVLEFVIMLIAVVAAVYLLRTFVITPYEVPTGSMQTTIMIKDRIFSERITYYMRDPLPGEIVTFPDPEDPKNTFVKRVIATEGYTVDLQDGKLVVNGIVQQESYTNGLPSYPLVNANGVTISYPYTIPKGYAWVMGDNRTNSKDSRYFGPIPVSSISGHAVFTYWPLDRIGPLS